MTTVGYGDISPHTTTGKVLAVGLMFIGIGFVALLTGAIAERFVAPRLEAAEQDLAGDVEIAETDLLAELHAVAERLARVEAALERRGRSDAEGQGPRKT